MALAIILVLLVVASVLFNFLNPWVATPLASNWGTIDDTIVITLAITGFFCIVITLFLAWALVRFRHRSRSSGEGHQASYAPDNKKLEWWLTGLTTIGICGMLAPGLVVYSDFVHVPEDADVLEVVGQQWRWSFRLPGKDGELGKVGIKHMNLENPFGIEPEDPNGQDDILIHSNELHIPIDQPVKFVLRSLDVLHDFYVPHFRAKMDMVPGQVSYFWLTPTVVGKYEILCAEYCGIAHYNMRGHVVVDTNERYQQWLSEQPTFAQSLTQDTSGGLVEQGRQLAEGSGCIACHSVDGSKSLAPGWKDLFGKTEMLTDGTNIVVDETYFKESVTNPTAKLVQGFPPVMVPYKFTDGQLDALIAYTKSLSESAENNASAAVFGGIDLVEKGKKVAQTLGCIACHSIDGSKTVGPTWSGLYGKTEVLTDGSSVVADDDYLKESITNPAVKIVDGYPPVMQSYALNEEQLDALVALIKSTKKQEKE
jgi:cytochrome c oxidase subunit II